MTNWDKFFYDLANLVSTNSKCFSRKVGAVIVRDKTIISTGYNGPPRGVPHCNERFKGDKNIIAKLCGVSFEDMNQCPRKLLGFQSGEGLEFCIAGHAERNAIVNAAREGIAVKDSIMYMNCEIPCSPCLIEIINAGIKEIHVINFNTYDNTSHFLIRNSKLKIRNIDNEELIVTDDGFMVIPKFTKIKGGGRNA